MSTLVYLHGTNGSGKSTLARAVLAAGGGPSNALLYNDMPFADQDNTVTKSGVVLIGRYKNACGGVDGVQPYRHVHNLMDHARRRGRAFAEGLITPGVETCKTFASKFDRTVFILLDTPETVCIRNVLRRRKAKGNTKPYSPDNLYTKARSARSWANNLEASGLEVHRLQYREAYVLILELLGLPSPSVEELLS